MAETNRGAIGAMQNGISVGTDRNHNSIRLFIHKLLCLHPLLKAAVFLDCLGIGKQFIFVR